MPAMRSGKTSEAQRDGARARRTRSVRAARAIVPALRAKTRLGRRGSSTRSGGGGGRARRRPEREPRPGAARRPGRRPERPAAERLLVLPRSAAAARPRPVSGAAAGPRRGTKIAQDVDRRGATPATEKGRPEARTAKAGVERTRTAGAARERLRPPSQARSRRYRSASRRQAGCSRWRRSAPRSRRPDRRLRAPARLGPQHQAAVGIQSCTSFRRRAGQYAVCARASAQREFSPRLPVLRATICT